MHQGESIIAHSHPDPEGIRDGTARLLPHYYHSVYLNIGKRIRSDTLPDAFLPVYE